jgi:O-antigen ligase
MRYRLPEDMQSEEPVFRVVWNEVYAFLAFLPILFITVNGRIQADSGPVAFRFTAMAEDSFARKLVRLGCSLLMLCLVSSRSRAVWRTCRRSKLILFLPLLGFASIAWSQNPSHSLVDAANLMLTTLFAVYLYVRYPGERLVSIMGIAAAIALLLSMLAVIAFPDVGIDGFQQNAWRGIFGQRNNCATVCVLFLAVGLHWHPRDIVERTLRGSVLALSAVFIVMSGSRTGWMLAVLALLLTFGLRLAARMRSLDRVLFGMVAAAVVLLTAFFVASNFTQLLALMDKDPTLTQRTIIWAEVLPSIAKHPWTGYGYSSFWAGLNGESMQTVLTTGWMEGQAQDGYLDVLLQLGFIGLLPLCWLFARGFIQAGRAIQRGKVKSAVLLAPVLLGLVLCENIGESSLLLPLGVPWFYALLAFVTLGDAGREQEVA